ncbi:MAG: aminopeptidase P family protein [Candidatus Saganbacteria bacterium]|nr:aminopeptidase P family protein [Candidatus Saganbacteria bacterium]
MNAAQKKAVLIADRIMSRLKLRAGRRESEIADWIKAQLKAAGAKPAFRIIVGSGPRSARPHCFASNKKLKRGELVVVDFGALYNGYRSDITRTYIIGKPAPKQKKIYGLVKKAQARAVRLVRAGQKCSEVDRAARRLIDRHGFGGNFRHSTGHGVGQRIHEAPKISPRNYHRLKAGAVITIEPGIYIKGWGGVRIEDMFLVTRQGCRRLTKAKK